MTTGRPRTPAAVARRLRRESGYGCCRCGFPVVQYHHIVPWQVDNHFRPEDMMALCPNCHDAVTRGAIEEAIQRDLKANPFNQRRGHAGGVLLMNQRYAAIRCGGSLLVGDGAAILIDGEELVRLSVSDDREFQLSIHLKDEAGNSLALIDRNEWVSGDPALWDLSFDHRKLKLLKAARDIRLSIDARGVPVMVRADLWHEGHRVRLNSAGISWGSSKVELGGLIDVGLVGMSIDVLPAEGAARLSPYRERAVLVSEADPIDRLRASLQAWSEIIGEGAALKRTEVR